jgi:hypothetical protein
MISTSANTVPPADGQISFLNRFSAVVAAVVFTVSTDVCAAEPLIVTEAGERLHVGGSLAAAGVMEQLRFTVNPFDPVTVMVAVFPVVAPGSMLIGVLPPLIVMVGTVTVRAMVVDAVRLPEVPAMVTVTGPAAEAALLAVRVAT